MKNENVSDIVILAVLIVLIVGGTGIVGYICYNKDTLFSKTNNVGTQNSNPNNNSINDVLENEGMQEVNLAKCLNTKNILYSDYSNVNGKYGLSMAINPDNTSVTLSINWNEFGPYSTASVWPSTVENFQITGFTKNIISTFISDMGQEDKKVTLFFLMDDGTVEYMPVFNLKKDNQNNSYYEMNYTYNYAQDGSISEKYFVTRGVVNGVKNVVNIYNINAFTGTAVWKSVIGTKKDGSFYDLGYIVMK